MSEKPKPKPKPSTQSAIRNAMRQRRDPPSDLKEAPPGGLIQSQNDQEVVSQGSEKTVQLDSAATQSQESKSATLPDSDYTEPSLNEIAKSRSDRETKSPQNDTAFEQSHDAVVSQSSNQAESSEGVFTLGLGSEQAKLLESEMAKLFNGLAAKSRMQKFKKDDWVSGGMQVTRGTKETYRKLAAESGLRQNILIEYSLRACAPLWRALIDSWQEEEE